MRVNFLIVEDDFIIKMFFERVIIKLNHNVVGETDNGKECIHLVEKLKPDVVLMDINIKGEINGVETALIIQEKFGTRVVFITGYARGILTDEMINKIRPISIVKKPVNQNILTREIEKICKVLEQDNQVP
ncbi:MAG: response regulator [Flavobacteriales bacterium]|nr:response regulator [Flavobacteriales bacterium]